LGRWRVQGRVHGERGEARKDSDGDCSTHAQAATLQVSAKPERAHRQPRTLGAPR
jgi:hypothetical protein